MNQKQAIKQAFAEAEKDQQQKEIDRIKQIVRSHLEKIQSKKEARAKLDEEIRLLERDLDDLKAGRLDRICDRHEKDKRAREVRIIIVEKIEKEYVPFYPWRSPWTVRWAYTPQYTTIGIGTGTSLAISNNASSAQLAAVNTLAPVGESFSLTATGTQFSNFAGGSYQVGDRTINL